MSVTLTNLVSRMRTFLLLHDTYCAARGACACVPLPGLAARRVASSLTLAADATVEALPDAVLAVPEITRAIRTGELRAKEAPPRR